jgi:hypothetical protein
MTTKTACSPTPEAELETGGTAHLSARLEFEPLRRYLRRVAPQPAPGEYGGVHSLLSGADWQAYQRAQKAGAISSPVADRLAVALGVHPCHIWGEEWWQSASDEPRCAGCGEPLPWRGQRRDGYCSRACRARHAEANPAAAGAAASREHARAS